MKNTVIIMRGLPGSGKSYLVQKIKERFLSPIPFVCSADDYLYKHNQHVFNHELVEAHHRCLTRYKDALWFKAPIIVVDNTNTTWEEIRKYVLYAMVEEYQIVLFEPGTNWRWSAQDCAVHSQHNVPYETIVKMKERWEASDTLYTKILYIAKLDKGRNTKGAEFYTGEAHLKYLEICINQ